MVIYDLECTDGHRFEGWFPNAEAYESQQQEGMVTCTHCGSTDIRRLPTGGHVSGLASKPQALAEVEATGEKIPVASQPDPVIVVKAINDYIQKHFTDVGAKFSEKAIAMHQGKEEDQLIYGTATPEEVEKLEEEDVPYSFIPKVPDTFKN